MTFLGSDPDPDNLTRSGQKVQIRPDPVLDPALQHCSWVHCKMITNRVPSKMLANCVPSKMLASWSLTKC